MPSRFIDSSSRILKVYPVPFAMSRILKVNPALLGYFFDIVGLIMDILNGFLHSHTYFGRFGIFF